MTRRAIETLAKVIRGLPTEGVRRESVAVLIGTRILKRSSGEAWKKWRKACGLEEVRP